FDRYRGDDCLGRRPFSRRERAVHICIGGGWAGRERLWGTTTRVVPTPLGSSVGHRRRPGLWHNRRSLRRRVRGFFRRGQRPKQRWQQPWTMIGRYVQPNLPAAAQSSIDLDQALNDLAASLRPLILLRDQVLKNDGISVKVRVDIRLHRILILLNNH